MSDYGCTLRGRCASCPDHNMRCVATDGPSHSTVLFLGEAPGRDEDRGGRPFIGRAGGEFNHNYLKLAGLDRDRILITNSVRCRPENNKKPADSLRLSCAHHHLLPELEEYGQQLDLIVPMGGTACGLFEPKIDIATHHGFPITRTLFGKPYTVFPVYHPAAGLHSSGMVAPLIMDFERLGEFLGGRLDLPRYTWTGKERYEPVHGNQVAGIISGMLADRPRLFYPPAIDTEHVKTNGKKVLWSMQFSVEPGTGYLIRAEDRVGCEHLVNAANQLGYTMHYSKEDWQTIVDNGYRLSDAKGILYDTIQAAFVQAIHSGGSGGSEESSGGQWGSLGLKSLAWRMVGLEMRSYQDLVWGASKRSVLEWLEVAKELVPRRVEPEKPVVMVPGRLLPHLQKLLDKRSNDETYDLVKKWHKKRPKLAGHVDTTQELAYVESVLGEMPESESCLGWLLDAIDAVPMRERESHAKPASHPGRLVTILNRIERYTRESENYDPWEKWVEAKGKIENTPTDEQDETWVELMESVAAVEELGGMPEEGIDKAPFDEAVRYACEDAHATGLLRVALEKESGRLDRLRQVKDKDWVL